MSESPSTSSWLQATGREIARAGSMTWRAAAAAGRAAGDAAVHLVENAATYRDEAIGAANGLVGDGLEEKSSPLALPMTVRSADGAVLDLNRPLANQLGSHSGAVLLMVHGLMATEHRFRLADPEDAAATVDYGTLMARRTGLTPLYLRYNSGRHISENGRELARILQHLFDAWPEPLVELNLLGHSLGGLVIRSATHYGAEEDHDWAAATRRIFLLGTPHAGSPLEKAGNVLTSALGSLPVAQVLAEIGNRRSAGIKDLRFGALVDEDWNDRHPDALTWPRRSEVPLLAGARHYVGVATLGSDPDHPISKILGDVLVTQFSAHGHVMLGPSHRFPDSHVRVFPSTSHLRLAACPVVYEQIVEWWDLADPD
ncbi:MAG: hypothetical protein CL910_14575 [Deltaproteobacteria bacterium]|nr:hypothetical protein [Deltaproteobacteria bacterium]